MANLFLLPNNPARQSYRYTSIPIEAAVKVTREQAAISAERDQRDEYTGTEYGLACRVRLSQAVGPC